MEIEFRRLPDVDKAEIIELMNNPIVLHPVYWGFGKTLYEKIIRYAFETLNIESVIILFSPSRTRIKGILRLGFKKEKETLLEGEPFIRFRLFNSRLLP